MYTTTTKVYNKIGVTSTDVSTTIMDEFIAWGDALIESRTNKNYDSATDYTEVYDINASPYNKDVWTDGGAWTGNKPLGAYSRVVLKMKPVNSISNVFLLAHDWEIDKVYSFDDSETAYTDNTTEANSVRGTPFYAFAETVGTSDILYVGCQYRFVSLNINLSAVGVGGVLVWEYYDGTTWQTISVTESVTGADDLNASGLLSWSLPSDWQENEINSNTFYWIRARVTTGHSTSPKVNNISFGQEAVYFDELAGSDYIWDNSGRLIITYDYLSSGYNKVKIIYNAGTSTVPSIVEQLSTNLAGQQALVSLIGGSFDDITSGSKADEQWSTGEPYTNLRATIHELKKEEVILWQLVGKKVRFFTS